MATRRSSCGLRATKTTPMPPRASKRKISYSPIRRPLGSGALGALAGALRGRQRAQVNAPPAALGASGGGGGGDGAEDGGAPGRPDFLWLLLAQRVGDLLESFSIAEVCRIASSQGVPRADAGAEDYQI